MAIEYKKLAGVNVVETATDAANVLIEEGGTIKRVPKTEVGGDGVSSWNDLTDRPFYEVEKEYKYDGVSEGKDTFVHIGSTYIKVSDDLPSIDSLKNGAVYSNGVKQYDMKYYSNNDTAFWDTMSGCLIVCYSTNITVSGKSISVPSTGVYLDVSSGNYLKFTELKTIDEKFIRLMYIDIYGSLEGTTTTEAVFSDVLKAFQSGVIIIARYYLDTDRDNLLSMYIAVSRDGSDSLSFTKGPNTLIFSKDGSVNFS